ncbi:MAG: RNA polymerase sigma factor [Sporichthyaceae bacterium]
MGHKVGNETRMIEVKPLGGPERRKSVDRREQCGGDFEAFYLGTHNSIVRVAYRLTRDSGDAEDIAQEAFTRAYMRWATVKTFDSPKAWVATVATNLALSRLRRIKIAAAKMVQHSGEALQEGGPELRMDVVRALSKLPQKQKVVLVLHYIGDISIRDIAIQTGSTEAGVKTSLHRGRQKLADLIGDSR